MTKKQKLIAGAVALAILGGGGTMAYKLTRGYRNNNPGNIKKSGDNWEGLDTPRDDGIFFRFKKPYFGIRAAARIIHNYSAMHGIYNIDGIIRRWSETDQEPYIKFVVEQTGIPAFQPINVDDFLLPILKAIFKFENGVGLYSDAQIIEGIEGALV